ncbi:MAG TPA: hypothetical protein VN366_09940 [Feifaniaceae bacterium]|nr:hypothetical protein [Feifaniaceae bacterium]
MPDYRAMYYTLAGKVADAIDLLMQAQQEAENIHIEKEDPSVIADIKLEKHKPTAIPRGQAQ